MYMNEMRYDLHQKKTSSVDHGGGRELYGHIQGLGFRILYGVT